MKRILVTGGDGYLGRAIVNELQTQAQTVRVMSRKPRPDTLADHLEGAQADVVSGDGIEAAVSDVDVIVNCLSSPLQDTYETDIMGTRDLLRRAKSAGVKHVLHISIIGIDRIIFQYYQHKLGAELVVMESGIPYTIARIAQFHGFVDYMVSALREVESDEVYVPVEAQVQPIDPTDVATYLAPYILGDEAQGRLDDFGGVDVLTFEEIVHAWLDAQGLDKTIVPATDSRNDIPFLDMFGDGFVRGYNTNPDNRVGTITWRDYLQQTYGVTA